MARDDRSIGEDAIALELKLKFGVSHSPTTIAKYMRAYPFAASSPASVLHAG